MDRPNALLAFEDGTVFHGTGFGASRTTVGEAVFNTAMTGYQEVLTDPSYTGQIVTMTAPQIGNYGINAEDEESDGPKVEGFVVRDLSPISSNWRSLESVQSYLERFGIPGIEGIDTRAVTKRLRLGGALKACLSTEGISPEEAVLKARAWHGLENVDYVRQVTCGEIRPFEVDVRGIENFSVPGTRVPSPVANRRRFKVAAIDLGAKRNIFRRLEWHGFDVFVVPATAGYEEICELGVDSVFLSNGPGDPDPLDYVHKTAARLIEHYPTFGICMGNHILTHALGARTFKLKFGHHGANQPVQNLETGKVSITSQNHGFAATPEELENRGAIVTEVNLNDGTVEGLRHKDLPVFSVQYHPEAAPGPHDSDHLFDAFYALVEKHVG